MSTWWNDAPLKAAARRTFTASASDVADAARARAPWRRVAASIGTQHMGNVIRVRASHPHAAMAEKGADPHPIDPRVGRILRMADGRFVTGGVRHPGFRGQPFLSPAARLFPSMFRVRGRQFFPQSLRVRG